MFFQFFYVGKESLQKLKTNKQLELQTVVMQFVRYKPMLLETVLYFWSSKIYCKTENCAFRLSLSTWFLLVLLRVSKCRLFGLRYSPQKGIFPLFFYSYLEFDNTHRIQLSHCLRNRVMKNSKRRCTKKLQCVIQQRWKSQSCPL